MKNVVMICSSNLTLFALTEDGEMFERSCNSGKGAWVKIPEIPDLAVPVSKAPELAEPVNAPERPDGFKGSLLQPGVAAELDPRDLKPGISSQHQGSGFIAPGGAVQEHIGYQPEPIIPQKC